MTFREIRAKYEKQGGGWIFDLVLNKLKMAYGSYGSDVVEGFIRFAPLLNSFLQDQIAYEYQIREFGRDTAERQYNDLLKKTEEAYTAVMDDFSDANINKTRKILLEAFDCLGEKDREKYLDNFEIFYESQYKRRIITADLCLKFRLELKKRLFGNNADNPPPPVATSTEAKEPNPKTVKKEKDYFTYTNKYVDLCRSVKPIYNRERAIEAVLREYGISERTLSRALDANSETLLKFGHEEKNFKKFSRVKWS